MKLHAWIIDRDYSPDGEPGTYLNATGLTGPRSASPESLAALAGGFGSRFRMLDDGIVMYSGRMVGDYGFAPLDDFGTPNAGCTEIQFWHSTGEWITL